MTFDSLKLLINATEWFSNLAQPGVNTEFVQIFNLAPWANVPTGDENLERIAHGMKWLPSSKDEIDPIHGFTLERRAGLSGKEKEISNQGLAIYKTALVAMRTFQGHPILKIGPHDFTNAARGAALYACRRASIEILLDEPGFWCRIMQIYHAGHWPCGILPNGQVVVL